MIATTEARRESRLRSMATRQNLAVRKDRARTWGLYNQGGYRIVDRFTNYVVLGEHFDLDLDDVEAFLTED